jgi:hypothetical protein
MMQMKNVNREIEKMLKSAIVVLSSKYNFDSEEGYRMICECSGIEVKSNKRSSSKNVVKSAFPLPYNGELNGKWCFGLRLNSGLYTQCPSLRPEDAAYCASCNKQATKNEHGLPDYGSIQTRSSKHFNDEEFVDPSGKKPVPYTKIMKKLKLTEEQVREEAAKHNMTLDPRHFVEAVKKSGRPAKEPKEPKEPLAEQKLKAKGRPKKSKKVLELAGEEEDLFASLVMSSLVPSKTIEEDVEEIVTSESDGDDNSSLGDVDVVVEAMPSKASKASKPKAEKMSPEEKAALAEQKAEQKAAQKKLEALAQQNQKKQEAEQKKLEALAQQNQKKLEALAQQNQKKQEAEQKKLLAKQEAEQKKLLLAEQKKQEKQALAEQKKQEKQALAEQKKLEKPASEKKAEKTKVDDDTPAFVDPAAEEADVVKKIMFEGKKYLKSKNTGIIYNMEQDVIGKWNEEKQRIDFNVVDEESEDDYDN